MQLRIATAHCFEMKKNCLEVDYLRRNRQYKIVK